MQALIRDRSDILTHTIFTLARFALLEALRTRMALLVLFVLGAGLGFSWLAGQVAITETAQIQAALMASFLRFAAVFILAAFGMNGSFLFAQMPVSND